MRTPEGKVRVTLFLPLETRHKLYREASRKGMQFRPYVEQTLIKLTELLEKYDNDDNSNIGDINIDFKKVLDNYNKDISNYFT